MDNDQPNYKAWEKKLPQGIDNVKVRMSKLTNLINHWKPKEDVWYFSKSVKVIATVSFVSSMLISWRWRKFFGMADGRTALMNIYIPCVVPPAFFSPVAYVTFTTLPMMSNSLNCYACAMAKAVSLNLAISTVYPLLLSAVATWYFSAYFNTYPMPDNVFAKSSAKYVTGQLRKGLVKNRRLFLLIGLVNILLISFWTDREIESYQNIVYKIKFHDELVKPEPKK